MGEALANEEDGGGTYRVVRLPGRGVMGEVYEVKREGTGERFALKCMRMRRAGDRQGSCRIGLHSRCERLLV
ncbi:hypothetical protein [Sorangium sp. So ce513]|uniref:hypothetical protein n=1 Tax=Sorangium sp. So ce513 TaxID=3133315 RepID=UPI003F5DB603